MAWWVVAASAVGAVVGEVVKVGYFYEPQPIFAGVARSFFDTESDSFAWFPQDSGDRVLAKLDQGDLDLAFIGSSPFSKGASRGVEAVAVFIQYIIEGSEALVLRRDETESPLDLEGKVIGVPFGSTAHYHLGFTQALNPSVSFEQVDLGPAAIVEAYDAGLIDGAFIWDAGLNAKDHIRANGGFTLLDSGLYDQWGKPTFMVAVAQEPGRE